MADTADQFSMGARHQGRNSCISELPIRGTDFHLEQFVAAQRIVQFGQYFSGDAGRTHMNAGREIVRQAAKIALL